MDFHLGLHIDFLSRSSPRVNMHGSMSSRGLLATVLDSSEFAFDTLLNNAAISLDLDVNGFNAIHNVVSCKEILCGAIAYAKAIEKLEEKGCDIDHQDNEGRTPFHVAVQRNNYEAVSALLMLDADVSVVDKTGKSPLAYLIKEGCVKMRGTFHIFAAHMRKVMFLRLDVSQLRELMRFPATPVVFLIRSILTNSKLTAELNRMKKIEIGGSAFTLRDFLTETAAKGYPTMPLSRRQSIDELVDAAMDSDSTEFPIFADLLKLQHRRAVARLALFKSAVTALQLFTGLPILCCEAILMHLSNRDLRSLISLRSLCFLRTL